MIDQADALISYFFPFVDTKELDLDETLEWFGKSVYIEERNKINMQNAISEAFGGEDGEDA